MPRKIITTTTETGPVDLTTNFTATSGGGTDYDYTASTDLRLLVRFPYRNSQDYANYPSTHTLSIAAQNDGLGGNTYSTESIGERSIEAFDADDTYNKEVVATFSGTTPEDNILTFGDGASDSPFTVSFWVKLDSPYTATGQRYFFGKGRTSSDSEYYGFYKPSSAAVNPNSIALELRDDSNTYIIRHQVDGVNLEDGDWHHIVMTYDGSGGVDSSAEIKFYFDGEAKTNTVSEVNNTSGYVAMEPISEEFHIGASAAGDTEIDGFMAEFAMWGTDLSENNVKAIYYAQYDLISESITYNSGYTNLSPRIQQRAIDNRPGCYPTKHRMGDKDRSGKNNIFYEDLPIQFGSRIYDNFENTITLGGYADETKYDTNKWSVSSGMSIKTEIVNGEDGEVLIDKCAVFSGPGTGGKRYISSVDKIINPTRFYFELIQGPYNQTTGGLDLFAAFPSDAYGIKVQISTDSAFTSPITVATYNFNTNQKEFYNILDDFPIPIQRRRKITLGLQDFAGLTESYYFRFVQESFLGFSSNWAIANIEIDYADQVVRYPLLLNHATGNNRFVTASLSTPHTDSDLLVSSGRSVKGISDISNPFKDFSESLSAFDETLAIEKSENEFFNQGLDPAVYPGFSSPTKSKTKFTIDLSPNEETTFGVTNQGTANGSGQAPGDDTSGIGQNYMVYWNKDLSKWEPIGLRTLHGGNTSPVLSFDEYRTQVIERAALGFGPVKAILKQDVSAGPLRTLDDDLCIAYSKPINTFLFPFGNQYVATGSQYILAEDLGITKPFLLEKVYIDFQAKLQFPGSVDNVSTYGEHAKAYSGSYLNSSNGVTRLSGLSARKLTFFLLRQFEDNKSINHTINIKPPSDPAYDDIKSYNINSGSSRELITYGQLGVFLTGSDYDNLDRPSIGEILDSKISGDQNLVVENWDHDSLLSLTGSYSINFKARNSARYKSGAYFNTKLSEYALLQKNNLGRGDGTLTSNSRALVNGLNGEGETVSLIADSTIGSTPHTKAELIDLDSPYLINPKDKLIFGWQYPPAQSIKDSLPIIGDSGFSNMTLYGKSKLHLYGSEIVENKEYHETVNQNLTSCAVYEHVIGDEKIVDHWQNAYRGELTGSYSRQHTYAESGYSTLHNKGISYEWWDTPQYSSLVKQTDPPTFRIGAGSYSNLDTFDGFNESIPSILQAYIDALQEEIGREVVRIAAQQYKSCYTSINFRDQHRLFADKPGAVGINVNTGKEDIVYYYDDSSYGTTQKLGFGNISGYSDIDRPRPVYSFNRNHFGYYSDLLQQGKDSKTVSNGPVNDGIEANFGPPVLLTQGLFVTGSFSALGIKTYTKKQTDFFLDHYYFQSSNLNQFMTSSIPFIDDDTPRNRSYITREFVAFNAETTVLGS